MNNQVPNFLYAVEEEVTPQFLRPVETAKKPDQKEGFAKSAARSVLQIPQALAEISIPSMIANLWQLLSMGEVLDEEEIDRLEQIANRQGVPFDRERYMQAAQSALSSVPTVSNIASKVEELTGAPLTPETGFQKNLRLGTGIAGLSPGGIVQKSLSAAGGVATKEGLLSTGVPEPLADIGGYTAGAITSSMLPGKSQVTKPSGLKSYEFEKITKPIKVRPKTFAKINQNLEADFREIADSIAKEAPIGATLENIAQNPAYIDQIIQGLEEVQNLAKGIDDAIPGSVFRKEMQSRIKFDKGIRASEYERSFARQTKKNAKQYKSGRMYSPEQAVEQYRKNNQELGELYEAGKSKAYNRGKIDALLEENRAIAEVFEQRYPDSEFVNIFKETNEQWSKLRSAETYNDFVNNIFKDGKINYKMLNDLSKRSNIQRNLEKGLGKEGYKKFKQAVNDLKGSEQAYKNLKIAESKGFDDLVFIAAPLLFGNQRLAKLGLAFLKGGELKQALQSRMLANPQTVVKFGNANKALKQGDFIKATALFEELYR